MNPEILNFISKERICVLSVLIDGGVPHSAAVHFSHRTDLLRFIVQTSNKTVKASPCLSGQKGKAAMVIGFSEDVWITLQMRGEVRQITDQKDLEELYKSHYAKLPEAEQYKGANTVFLEFTPAWWRYSDFNTEPETIIQG